MSLNKMNFNLNIDFNDLTLENIGSWPEGAKIIVLSLVAIGILFFGFWFDTRSQIKTINSDISLERKLKSEFEEKQQLASNLEAYKSQVKEMKKIFASMMEQLPNQAEIPNLLEDISKAGIANGLEFILFAPQQEEKKDFYAELPVKIKVIGNYYQISRFISDVGNMNRIVTLHDLNITPIKEQDKNIKTKTKVYRSNDLNMELLAKTYRYLENE